jgi:hypothetical protein
MYDDWENDINNRRLYYLDGIVSLMRIFTKEKITFLKKPIRGQNADFASMAVRAIQRETEWPKQANFDWSEGISAKQLRSIRSKEPVAFTKVVQAIVACEFALKALRPESSPYWVYDYMRVVPAVYNIDKFNRDTVSQILETPNAAVNIQKIAGPYGVDVCRDLADGGCVTSMTAHGLAEYITKNGTGPDCQVGPVRFKPGKKRLGQAQASSNEDVIIR